MMADVELGLGGRVCVVTGASSGIGCAVAGMLCQEGAHVMMIARDPQRLAQAATRIKEQDRGRVAVLGLDVTELMRPTGYGRSVIARWDQLRSW